jgi:hypothetical protein
MSINSSCNNSWWYGSRCRYDSNTKDKFIRWNINTLGYIIVGITFVGVYMIYRKPNGKGQPPPHSCKKKSL